MTIATISVLLCIGVCVAQDAAAPVLACNSKAISAAGRPRYNALMKQLMSAAKGRSELPDGYAFRLDGKAITLPEIAEWISMERRCCPFLTLQLSTSGEESDWLLKLTGPKGVKALLEAGFSR